MIGIIVTGHGNFASGLTSSVELIAGEQELYKSVDFNNEVEQLETDLKQAIESLNECESILVFTDLIGGSPFKTSALLTSQYPKLDILSGTNLAMLVECVLVRKFNNDKDQIIKQLLESGKSQVSHLDLGNLSSNNQQNVEQSDGI